MLCLFLANFGFGQLDTVPATSTISDTVKAKKILQVPPFEIIKLDTITLGQYDTIIHDSYVALGQPWVYDALHSFHSRRMDKFGGYINDKINAGLASIRQKGFNSDVKKLYIQINPKSLTVYWFAVVGPSEDGRCYVSVDSRGSAGGGLPAVLKQCPRMHNIHNGLEPVKLLDFNENVIQCYDWNSNPLDSVCRFVNIQQHFYKYYSPQIGSTITLADYSKLESEKMVAIATVPQAKKATATKAVSYRSYKVKSGDTLSQIAEKFHTTPSKIKKANRLRSDLIRAGQTLKIPR